MWSLMVKKMLALHESLLQSEIIVSGLSKEVM